MFFYTITKHLKILYAVQGARSYMAGILLPVLSGVVCLRVRNIFLGTSLLEAHYEEQTLRTTK
jgi:hypothetical protein